MSRYRSPHWWGGHFLPRVWSPKKGSACASGVLTQWTSNMWANEVHFWRSQTSLNTPAGPKRRFYLKLSCDFIVKWRIESVSVRSASRAALMLTPPPLTRVRTQPGVSLWVFYYRAQKRPLNLLSGGNKDNVGCYPVTWEGRMSFGENLMLSKTLIV